MLGGVFKAGGHAACQGQSYYDERIVRFVGGAVRRQISVENKKGRGSVP